MLNVGKEIAVLKYMTAAELRARYAEVFGEESRSHHKDFLVKRIAWRLQSQADGDLSERARARAAKLANDADIRTTPPRRATAPDGQSVAAGPSVNCPATCLVCPVLCPGRLTSTPGTTADPPTAPPAGPAVTPLAD